MYNCYTNTIQLTTGHYLPSYVMLGDPCFAAELRQLAAQCVSSDPQTYSAGFLGRENNEYCTWIQSKDSWGGGLAVVQGVISVL